VTFRLVASDDALENLIDEVLLEERYALDTEFHRERTYFPRLALVQLAWAGGIAIVDPLACDPAGLRRLLLSDRLAVVHAAQQDLDVLTHACSAVPTRLIDTQLLAGFLGYSTPSLSALVNGELGIALAKGDRLTDWLARPLTEGQLAYAASDVEHLLDLYDRLATQLAALGRDGWAYEACEELRTRPVGPMPLDDAWLRIKDARTLKARARGVARSVAAWREERARRADVPTRQVLPDLAILGIAQQAPRTVEQLSRCRGLDARHTRGPVAEEILIAVAQGLDQPVELPKEVGDELDRRLRPAVTLVSAWVAELARQERIDTALLATRADLTALLRGDETARLRSGWRSELVGEGIARLVEGRAGLTFDGQGGLRLFDVPEAG
jgi:ribonuclease D